MFPFILFRNIFYFLTTPVILYSDLSGECSPEKGHCHWWFNNLKSHHQSQLNNVVSLVMTQAVKTSVTT